MINILLKGGGSEHSYLILSRKDSSMVLQTGQVSSFFVLFCSLIYSIYLIFVRSLRYSVRTLKVGIFLEEVEFAFQLCPSVMLWLQFLLIDTSTCLEA